MSTISNNSAITRIESLLDMNSFVEIGSEIKARSTDFHLYKEETPSDGVITGYGLVDGQLVFIYSQDSSVLGGAIGEMHSRKITNLYDMALKMGAPVIGMIDCSGLRLQESTDAMNGLGSIFQKQALASGVILQFTVIMGSCGGGVSVIPALSDFTFVENKKGSLFLQSPNAIPSNNKNTCDTSSAEWKSRHSQNIDFCGSEEEIYETIRKFISIIPANNRFSIAPSAFNDDANRLCSDLNASASDSALALSMIADEYEFVETKKETAKEMVTGFIRLGGMTIGCVANRQTDTKENISYPGVLTAAGVRKAASFVKFCDAFHIPVLTLSNVTGFESSFDAEIYAPAALAELTAAYAYATVPKVTLITDKSMGSASTIMGSKSIGSDLVYAWNKATTGPMDGMHAAKILYEGESAATIRNKASEYDESHNSASAAASRGYVDMLITPENTRKYLISAFDMLATKQETRNYKKHLSI